MTDPEKIQAALNLARLRLDPSSSDKTKRIAELFMLELMTHKNQNQWSAPEFNPDLLLEPSRLDFIKAWVGDEWREL